MEYKPTILDNANPNIANSHLNGYTAELKLANEIVALPDQAVVKYGDAIGRNGADVISVDVKTGEVTLWDSKYRSGSTIIQESPTFTKEGPLTGALTEAVESIRGSTLPEDIKMKALQNLKDNTYTTNTVGAGNVKNSVTTKICNGKPCGE